MNNISMVFQAHDMYVEGYERLEQAALSAKSWLSSSCPGMQTVQKVKDKVADSIRILYSKAIVPLTVGTLKVSNRVLRRPQNATIFRSFRPELKEANKQVKIAIASLSNDISILFGRKIIFPMKLTTEEIQEIVDSINRFRNNNGTLSHLHTDAIAKRATATCLRINQLYAHIDTLLQEDISSKDIEAFQTSVNRNIIWNLSVSATMENIGEAIGGLIADDSGMVLSRAHNPAVLVGSKVRECIGSPLGRLGGIFVGTAGILYLLNKIPLQKFERNRSMIQLGAVFMMLSMEYMHWNPLTNVLEDVSGEMAYNFGFYSIAILFNYILMCAFGTEETLGTYVRNMTPATLTYEGSQFTLNALGCNALITFAISFFLSHVAYNAETYGNLLKGRLLSGSLNIKQINNFVDQQKAEAVGLVSETIKKSHSAFEPKMQQMYEAGIDMICQNRSFSQLRETATSTIQESMGRAEVDQLTQYFHKMVQTGIDHLQESLQKCQNEKVDDFEEVLDRCKNMLATHGKMTFTKVRAFFKIMTSPAMQQMLSNHRKETFKLIDQSKANAETGNLGAQNSLAFAESEKKVLDAFFRSYAEECDPSCQITPKLRQILEHIWISELHAHVDQFLDMPIKASFPSFFEKTPESEACSVEMIDLLLRFASIFAILNLETKSPPFPTVSQITEQEFAEFLSSTVRCVFDFRYPSRKALKSLQKNGAHLLIQSQLHPTS